MFGMPQAAIKMGAAGAIIPLSELPEALTRLVT